MHAKQTWSLFFRLDGVFTISIYSHSLTVPHFQLEAAWRADCCWPSMSRIDVRVLGVGVLSRFKAKDVRCVDYNPRSNIAFATRRDFKTGPKNLWLFVVSMLFVGECRWVVSQQLFMFTCFFFFHCGNVHVAIDHREDETKWWFVWLLGVFFRYLLDSHWWLLYWLQ